MSQRRKTTRANTLPAQNGHTMEVDRPRKPRAVQEEDPLKSVSVTYDPRFFVTFILELNSEKVVFGLSPTILPNQAAKRSSTNMFIKSIIESSSEVETHALAMINEVFFHNNEKMVETVVKVLDELHIKCGLGKHYYTHASGKMGDYTVVAPMQIASNLQSQSLRKLPDLLYDHYIYAKQHMQTNRLKESKLEDEKAAKEATMKAQEKLMLKVESVELESYCEMALSQPLFLNFMESLMDVADLNAFKLKRHFNNVEGDMRSNFQVLAKSRYTLNFLMDLYIYNLVFKEIDNIGEMTSLKVLCEQIQTTNRLAITLIEPAFKKFVERLNKKNALHWLQRKSTTNQANQALNTDELHQAIEGMTVSETKVKSRMTTKRIRSPDHGLDDIINGFSVLGVAKTDKQNENEKRARAAIAADGLMRYKTNTFNNLAKKTGVHFTFLYALDEDNKTFALAAENVMSVNVLTFLNTILNGPQASAYLASQAKRTRHRGGSSRKQLHMNWLG